jgi:hypothetical protein
VLKAGTRPATRTLASRDGGLRAAAA